MNEKAQKQSTSPVRYLWITLGCLSFAIGTIGIFLPILPTIPFYMLTLFFFSKGSKRLQAWFLETSFYKENLEIFYRERALTVKSKITAFISLTIMMGFGFYMMSGVIPRVILSLVWIGHIVWLLVIVKTYRPVEKIPTDG